MHWQIERKVVFVDYALLNDNLIKVCHHVVNTCEVYHLHVEAHRFIDIHYFYVHRVGTTKERAFLLFVTDSYTIENFFLCTLFLCRLYLILIRLLLTSLTLRAWFLAFCLQTWLYFDNLIIDVIFSSDKSFLDTLYNFLPL